MVIALALVGSSCGDSGSDQVAVRTETSLAPSEEGAEGASDAADSDDDAESDAAAGDEEEAGDDESGDGEAEDVEPEALRLPTSDDPCLEPPELPESEFIEYQMELVGQDRPVGIRVGSQAALSGGVLVLSIHGASQGWKEAKWAGELDEAMTAEWPPEQQIAVIPQAEPASPAFWTETETSNVEYMEQLFATLSQTFCFDQLDILARSAGQGSLALNQAMCERTFPIDLHVMFGGMLKIDECAQPPNVPIISIDQFDFHPNIGHSWDHAWDPPGVFQQTLTGGLKPTPEDLAVWADQYGCTDEPVETLYSEGLPERFERPPVSLSYSACAAPLLAIGVPTADSGIGVDPEAFELVRDLYDQANLAALGR